MRQVLVVLVVVASLAAVAPAFAQTPADSERPEGVNDSAIMSTAGFLGAHPDMHWRIEGQEAQKKGDLDEAMTFYRRAARYGDKPSQGMVGEMYWLGQGVEVDRALAYAWMDIAAERGYPFLLAKREHYWNAMNAEERERALQVGAELYAEYGDPVAKPRLEVVLRRERRGTTGSRTGFVGNLEIVVATPGGSRTIRGNEYYADKFWEPAMYWRWQDHDWRKPGLGTVEVGDVLTDANEPALDDAPAQD